MMNQIKNLALNQKPGPSRDSFLQSDEEPYIDRSHTMMDNEQHMNSEITGSMEETQEKMRLIFFFVFIGSH